MDTPTTLQTPDPHPSARVTLTLLRSVIKLTALPAAVFGLSGLLIPPCWILALGFGAVTLVCFFAAFIVVFLFYARYSLRVMIALIAILNMLVLCVLSRNGLLIVGGIFGIGLYISLLCIRIVGFYPEIEDPPRGEIHFLLSAVGRLRFGWGAVAALAAWFAVSIRLLSESLAPSLFWAGVASTVTLAGFLLAAVVKANVPAHVESN